MSVLDGDSPGIEPTPENLIEMAAELDEIIRDKDRFVHFDHEDYVFTNGSDEFTQYRPDQDRYTDTDFDEETGQYNDYGEEEDFKDDSFVMTY